MNLKKTWSKDDYTLEQRKTWYSQVANDYNRVRPRYPREIIARAIELAQLPPQAAILEIGCGPGTATVEFARRGFSLVCLEPSLEAYQLARLNCTQYSSVEIKNSTFEEWELPNKFNAVLAANSFHWVSSEVAYAKTADALKNDGSLMLLWNTAPQPTYSIYQLLEPVYQSLAPSLPQYVRYEAKETQENSLNKQGQNVLNSGLFKDLLSEQMVCEATYSLDDYLALLSTFSPYIALEPQKRESLLAQLRKVLETNGISRMQCSYLSVFHIAQLVMGNR